MHMSIVITHYPLIAIIMQGQAISNAVGYLFGNIDAPDFELDPISALLGNDHPIQIEKRIHILMVIHEPIQSYHLVILYVRRG